ncbi:MAG: sugar phosphate isomerase/epimerase [Anaerolineae bacterium]|jgi:xylose isomerase|nr:sugar phosphate isomerase/epimerase [Anaerolineae bacterium]
MSEGKYAVIVTNYNYPTDRFNKEYGIKGANNLILKMIEIAGKQGLAQGLEFNMDESDPDVCTGINEKNWKEIRSALDANGLEIIGIASNLWSSYDFANGTFGATDPKVRKQALDLVKRTMDVAANVGAPYVNIWPGQDGYDYYLTTDYVKAYDWWIEGMQAAADHNPGIKLGFEPKPFEPRSYSTIGSVSKSLLMIRDVNRKNVGLNMDVGHMLFEHENLGECVALAQREGGKLFHLHMNDNYANSDADMMFASVHFLAFLEMFFWLRKTNYSGWKSLDLFNYRTDPKETIAEGIRWMMAFDELIDRIGMDKLEEMIKNGNAVENMAIYRKFIFNQK